MAEQEKKTPSVRELVLALGGMLATTLVYVNTLHSQGEVEIKREQKAIEEAQRKLEKDEQVIVDLQKAEAATDNEQKQDARLTTIREANNNFTNIVKTLSSTDEPDLFTIKSLNVEKEEKFQDYSKVLFKLELEAPFLHVGQFLEKLERSNLLTELLSVETLRIDPELKRCTVKLSLYSYVSRI